MARTPIPRTVRSRRASVAPSSAAARSKRARTGGASLRPALRVRVRVYVGKEIAIGPGKADLLAWIDETGSIRRAAQGLGMSYMRAWELVRTMNRCFESALVETVRGGASGGESRLTPAGREILALYRQMATDGSRAAAPVWRKLRQRLRG